MSRKPTLLIIDDILENVQVLGDTLADTCNIQFADSGEEGLELIEKNPPDLILLDVMMPGMNGYEVFSILKSDPKTEAIPVIFVTARTDFESESEALNAGAADFIHKPINPKVARARVKQQLELAQHRNHLEKLVIRRTEELAVALAEAESANAVKTRFLANVSHEMRTPMQGILGFSEIGARRAKKEDQETFASYFDHIAQSGQRMHLLVESLLTLADKTWIEHIGLAGQNFAEIDVRDFSSSLVSLLELQAHKRKQHLLLTIQSKEKKFTGDPIRLHQVIEHLLKNALSYSPVGAEITICISDTRIHGSTPALSFRIIDSGCGIPEAEINAIFEPFYQSSRTASGAGGTGLGLPLSRCIVARHGGTLTVSNRAEGGVVSEVMIPVNHPSVLPAAN